MCHVQESPGKYPERGVGSGETETNEFGVTGAEKDRPQDLSDLNGTGNQDLDQSCV